MTQATDDSPPGRPAVFFDRDNTLIVGADYLGDPAQVVLMEGAARCVAGARRLGYAVVTASNQSGVARGMYGEDDVRAVNARMDELLRQEDPEALIDRHEFCPHHPDAEQEAYRQTCACRKPLPGLLQSAAQELGLDLSRSWLVGDAPRDIEAGKAAGCRTILLSVPGIEQSPAASQEERIAPDFRATSLEEVLAILTRETKGSRDADESLDPAADRIAATTAQILDDLRRQREAPRDEFSVYRLLAGVTQVLALGAVVWGLINDGHLPTLVVALFLQTLTLTLVSASR